MIDNVSFNDVTSRLKTGKICLLDADYIKYIVCDRMRKRILLNQENEEKSADIYLKEEPIITLTKNFLSEEIFGKIEDPILFCFSGKSYNTFRSVVAFEKEYKGNRKSDETYEGQRVDAIKIAEYIIKNYTSLIFDDLEADDIVSILQDENTYIVSKDKDLKQVPGFHYNWSDNSIYEITKEQALYNLATQLITGDSTDNITGIPKYGPKKALNYLKQYEDKPSYYIQKVMLLYQKEFGVFHGTDMFVETWNLVKMRENRGEHFKRKHQKMFDVKEYMVRNMLK